jgi:hypothetical protein
MKINKIIMMAILASLFGEKVMASTDGIKKTW